MTYTPPFSLTPRILTLSQDISHALGVLEDEKLDVEPVGTNAKTLEHKGYKNKVLYHYFPVER